MNKALVPALRFPEFRDKGEWAKEKLGRLIDIKGRIGYRGYTVNDIVSEGKGAISVSPSNIDDSGYLSFEKSTYISWDKYDESPEIKLEEGFTVLVKTASVGKTALVRALPVKATINPQIVVLKPLNINSVFLFLAVSGFSIQKQIREKVAGGAIPTLSQESISKFDILVPCAKEQQKIANCLTSIDELITAQFLKLNALKTHKNGLMQQLFPAKGETVPKLRFPEFWDKGEWSSEMLGSKTKKVGSGITPTGGDKNYKSAGRPFVRSQNVGWGCLILDDVAYIDDETHSSFSATEIQKDDVLLNITGASIGRSTVANQLIEGGNVNQHVCIIRTKKKELNPLFLNQFLISQVGQIQIDSFQAGGNRQGLNFAQIRSFTVPMPPKIEEQQKIANCLTSIDDLISIQANQVEVLKAHKKGLMQQLFPAMEEVSA